MELEPVIGLEIHVQLKTKSKMFCRCSNDAEGVAPNTHICEVCTGQPGTLPVPNEEAVEMILRAGLALGSELPDFTKFDRKHYFYPDLPKGYQISQYEEPFCVGGTVEVEREDGSQFIVEMERLHLEEDAGKLVHEHGRSGVDLNRAGTPLIECVTKPVVKSAADARLFLQELRRTMRYLGVSDADMEKGHLRCDANISMRPVGDNKLYPKTEIKNVNSFKFVEQALEFEIVRQTGLWEKGTPVDVETTRGFDPSTGKTIEQRTKEGAADYRYFPEPDIPPFVIDATRRSALARHLPELPARKRARFVDQFGLSRESAFTIVDDKSTSDFYENVLSEA
ncbi:MAG: Asp-tRNA(Asn)/Glu-tRNA(Gln) amidotransferase subunit GatB, partial [Candidatus Andersenbacteria bacterium]|nr:Asp-tRNA(Asn)/Glu-tRNA(Gln) amidotransferase subunit GatB [Candidatus Andersenbacteria bacterium]